MTYAVSPQTGEVVANLFEDRDINHFIPDTVTYLTRSDWNTFPETVTTLTATPEIQDLMENFQYEKPADAADISAYKFKQDNGITFIDMKDVPFDDPKWDEFIDQLTVGELAQITGDKMGLDKVESVSMPAYSGGDGPDGYQAGGVLYNAEMLCAGTFSKEMVRLRGDFFGEAIPMPPAATSTAPPTADGTLSTTPRMPCCLTLTVPSRPRPWQPKAAPECSSTSAAMTRKPTVMALPPL